MLLETIRDYNSEKFKLNLCRDIERGCEKGLKCSHAHSQAELDSWNEQLKCRSSSDKMLEMCRNVRDCSYGDDCRYAHNSKELRAWNNGEFQSLRHYWKMKENFWIRSTLLNLLQASWLGMSILI